MAQSRSFAEYVKDKCYGGLFEAAEQYVGNNWGSLENHVPKAAGARSFSRTVTVK